MPNLLPLFVAFGGATATTGLILLYTTIGLITLGFHLKGRT